MPDLRWTVVVPVKDAAVAKSRLAGALPQPGRARLVRAMALDTIGAALAAEPVDRVLVVCGDRPLADVVTDWPDVVVLVEERSAEECGAEDRGAEDRSAEQCGAEQRGAEQCGAEERGVPGRAAVGDRLNAALRAGVAQSRHSDPGAAVAILLADLPMLTPGELADALDHAASYDRALVADAAGTGTTLLTARPGVELVPAFGPGSARAHELLGHTRLDIDAGSGLRRDVDLPDDVVSLATASPGRWTSAALG